MLSIAGVGCNEYAGVVGRSGSVPSVACPTAGCHGRLQRGHGFYKRYVDGVQRELRRLLCPACGVTNALLPEDLCAYRDATLTAVEAAADKGPGPAVRARAARETGHEAKRRVRRWGLEPESRWVVLLVALLPAGPEHWLERVRAVVGAGSGALVRLRRWLWESYTVFLGGPCGLFRLGRPGGRPGAAPHRDW
jgi:hypothetical protein